MDRRNRPAYVKLPKNMPYIFAFGEVYALGHIFDRCLIEPTLASLKRTRFYEVATAEEKRRVEEYFDEKGDLKPGFRL